MTHVQRQVLTTTCLSHGLIHVYELSVPALLILIQQEFGVGDLRMGEVVTLYDLLFGLGALPAGYLVDRFGSRSLLTTCLWGASLSLVGMAVSPSLGMFSLAAAVMGLSLSIYHPAGTALITHALPVSGRVFALHGMAGNGGIAAATLIAGSLGALVGWRVTLGALSLLGFALGLQVLRLQSPELHEIRSRPGRGQWSDFALLLIAAAFLGMVYRGMTTFLPKFFATTYGHADGQGTAVGGALTTATLIVGLVGMYAAGRIADRGTSPAWLFLVAVVAQAPLLVAMGTATGSAILPLAMGVAFFHFFTQPVANKMVAQFTPARLRGLGYGIYFFMAFGAGSLGATLTGWMSENVGLASAFPALAVLLVPTTVVTVIVGFSVARRAAAEQPAEGTSAG